MKKLLLSPTGELIHPDDKALISQAIDNIILFADESNPVEQWTYVSDEPDDDGTWPVLRDDYRGISCDTLSTHPTREAAQAEANRLNDVLSLGILNGMETVEIPDPIDPSDIVIGSVEDGKYPQSRRCAVHIGDREIHVHWQTDFISDRQLNTAAIKAALQQHFKTD